MQRTGRSAALARWLSTALQPSSSGIPSPALAGGPAARIAMEQQQQQQPAEEQELARPTRKDGRFSNPSHWPAAARPSPWQVMRWILLERGRFAGHLEGIPKPTPEQWAAAFPLRQPDWAALHSPPEGRVQALWLGHASLLVQMGGLTFLTDPVLSQRCSPLSFAGPKRLVQPPLSLGDPRLPRIDCVLLSHNHYDHLDTASVKQLHARFGSGLTWYVPLRMGAWFESVGVPQSSVVELDWWQQVQHSGTKATIALTPAQHWSNRGTDRCRSLWGGFAVAAGGLRFWFAGDSGYCPVFPQIGRKYGPFDLAAIPIGAYHPRWLFGPEHCDPAEAVRIHQEVRSQRSIAIHHGTFNLTDEPLDEPPRLLAEAAAAAGLPADAFVSLQHGGLIATAGGRDAARSPLLFPRRQPA